MVDENNGTNVTVLDGGHGVYLHCNDCRSRGNRLIFHFCL